MFSHVESPLPLIFFFISGTTRPSFLLGLIRGPLLNKTPHVTKTSAGGFFVKFKKQNFAKTMENSQYPFTDIDMMYAPVL